MGRNVIVEVIYRKRWAKRDTDGRFARFGGVTAVHVTDTDNPGEPLWVRHVDETEEDGVVLSTIVDAMRWAVSEGHKRQDDLSGPERAYNRLVPDGGYGGWWSCSDRTCDKKHGRSDLALHEGSHLARQVSGW
ncbi:MAG: hypothetical protein OXQ29_02435 [Rhodospirillaceae bacterium]|nr:hypothetical protein [Rhodospirillaceae bacterium]